MFIFPFVTFIFLLLGFYRRYVSRCGIREAFLLAAVAWGLLLAFATEFLSAFQLLSRPYVSVFWVFTSMAALCFCVFLSSDPLAKADAFGMRKNWFAAVKRLTMLDGILLSLTGLILLSVALTAFMAPPNNWDSLVYHMGRVAHWLANQTAQHYPTNIKTQIYYPPFAEWVILHFQILLGTDQFANFAQWFSMLGCAVGASLLARFFGAGQRGQIFAAFLTATIPMGILQGSSTQNDYVLSFWSVIFVYFGLRWQRKGQTLDALAAGGALGLGILTKALAYFLALPFLLWFFIAGVQKFRSKAILSFLIVAVLALAVNFNHLQRNFELCGHFLGEDAVSAMTRNERIGPASFASNVMRNIGLHLATSSKPLNNVLEKGIYGLHHLFKIDIVDPATTLGSYPFHISESLHEDAAGNFFQLVLILAAGLIFLWQGKDKGQELRDYLLALIAAFALFNVFLKWQPAGSRLHLPFFVLFMPFVATVFSSFRRRDVMIAVVSAILLSTAVPYVVRNSTRKLISSKRTVFAAPRLEQYFADAPALLKPYQGAADFVASQNCREVGLRIGDNSWEYPFWVIFKQSGPSKARLEHVDVIGIKPANYPLGEFNPCAIIETGRTSPPDERLKISAKIFVRRWEQSPVKVYTPE